MNEYDQQAEAFLKATNTKLSMKKIGHFKYFPNDTQTRDVYDVTLENGKHSYTFRFGQSIQNSEWANYNDREVLTMAYPFKRNWTTYDLNKARSGHKGKKPTAYDILASLFTFDGLFDDFCADFGYDEDSRIAFSIYQDVLKQSQKLHRLFTDEELEQLAEIN